MKASTNCKGKLCAGRHCTAPKCAKCGAERSHFTVEWIIPQRIPDLRPACSAACALALLQERRAALADAQGAE